ncbi:trifunctional UDP-glucose 4,6-dehydratase/UDP-4-keto-6-deoxy-D-glucose 3,5-epimerase/UDP-4-keto-L-rhamnose-reductase RHM1-like protein [Tanacetum coccineum]
MQDSREEAAVEEVGIGRDVNDLRYYAAADRPLPPSDGPAMSVQEKILVMVRVRPLTPKEASSEDCSAWVCIDNRSIVSRNKESQIYIFDKVFKESCQDKEIYEGARDVALSAVKGINATIIAYGQSGSGVCKSWRLAATRTYHNSNGPPSRLPSLMLAVKSDREIFLFQRASARYVGKDFASQLINPLSREIINLPKVDTFPKSMFPFDWDDVIRKVVLVMELKLVVVIWGNCKLGLCHIGDNKWTSIETMASIRDITFFNGYVYSSDICNAIVLDYDHI